VGLVILNGAKGEGLAHCRQMKKSFASRGIARRSGGMIEAIDPDAIAWELLELTMESLGVKSYDCNRQGA
jgi:hypothetical protein